MKAFPYDSVVTYDADGKPIYDRFVLAETERAMNRKLFTSGIFANPLGAEVTVHSGMTVSVSPFTFMIDGVKGIEEFTTQWTLDVGGSLPRYDRIVLRNDNSTSTRFPNITILKGTPASSPTAPPITRSGDIYDLVFATIFVGAQVTELANEKIEDDRLETSLCGVVTQAIDSVDTTTIFNQLQSQVDENMALIQSALDDTTAGYLQGQIDTNKTAIDNNTTNISDNISELDDIKSGVETVGNSTLFSGNPITSFLFGGNESGMISISNTTGEANAIRKAGFYYVARYSADMPVDTDYYFLLHMQEYNIGEYAIQFAIPLARTSNNVYFRKLYGGTWSAWSIII